MGSRYGQQPGQGDDPMAYGEYPGRSNEPPADEYEGQEGERGIVGDTYRKLRTEYQQYNSSGKPSGTGAQGGGGGGLGGFLFGKLQDAVGDIGNELKMKLDKPGSHTHTHATTQCDDGVHSSTNHRYGSFAPQRTGDDAKWYVDGCSYFWAVSLALERATESIWILDWWLSPELYLRRPPARHEQYRLDRMLQAAAQRGVKINIIVYKEVTQALTLCSYHTKHALESLHPNIAVFRHPDHLPDAQTLQSSFWSSLQNISLNAKTASQLPQDALKALYGVNQDVVLYWAHHEKLLLVDGRVAFMGGLDLCFGRWDTNQHPIADCHPSNLDDIVFPGQDYNNARIMDFQDVSHYQQNKVDRKTSSRMGWSDISISLAGPVVEDLRSHFVERWNFIYNEKYDVRQDTRYSRLTFTHNAAGAVPHHGQPAAAQFQSQSNQSYGQFPPPPSNSGASHASTTEQGYGHFPPPPSGPQPSHQSGGPEHRYDQNRPPPARPQADQTQYSQGGPTQYPPPPPRPQSQEPEQRYGQYPPPPQGQQSQESQQKYDGYPPPPPRPSSSSSSHHSQIPYFAPPPTGRSVEPQDNDSASRGLHPDQASSAYRPYHQNLRSEAVSLGEAVKERFVEGTQHIQDQYLSGNEHFSGLRGDFQEAGIGCQIVRSCTKWSHGVPTEHSIANAYISIIENSQHFVYIENQFFITATSDAQKPVRNKIGAAIADRILRAARAGQKYKVIVVIPAVPGFAGDLKDDASLGTRAIMEFQYNSINRGGHSIMETVANAGYDPKEYIRFYNLRNYDRINVSSVMTNMEQRSGVDYEKARDQHDEAAIQAVELPAEDMSLRYKDRRQYQQYEQATNSVDSQQAAKSGRWDSVSECYMLNGTDIRNVPWTDGDYSEIDAFVSEELYIHSKVLIADDRVVIVGSANLNDRSQLGDHDSEIAVVIEDPNHIESWMDGRPHRAARFAATLRRQLFRKHLGLLKPQDMEQQNDNFMPIGVPNWYDYGSSEDRMVTDPTADGFLDFWNTRAQTNTYAFGKIFHPVPHDSVQTWKEYDTFYEHFFHEADQEADGKSGKKMPSKYMWGHVVAEEFSPGPLGVREVKDLLSTIKGTLVEMPLNFLIKEDIAKEGISLNAFTEEVYT